MLPTQILLNNFLYHLAQVTIPTDRVDPSFIQKLQRWNIQLIRNFMILTLTALNGGARVSRRIVTHNHHRSDFALLLADVGHHFQALALTPADVLRHISSPFAPDKDQTAPLSLA